ncbi:RICIN domain-containing protein [Amycolatopsis sp. NPDC049868]|uniref:RICIN domain-containing protein n=1 Tax=Amycolatopsis sp. NPDC049868 TaxID=3363934 RepID=UPI003798B5EC
MKKNVVRVLLGGVAVASGLVVAGWPASADTQAATHNFVNFAYGYCLDGNVGGLVYMNPCVRGNNFQKWTWSGAIPSRTTLKNVGTARCLSGNSAGDVYTSPCDGAPNRTWYVERVPSSTSLPRLRNYATGQCLVQTSEHGVRTATCNYNVPAQHWRIIV